MGLPRSARFPRQWTERVDSSFKKLASEFLTRGRFPQKIRRSLGLACSVAIRCEYCVKHHQESAMLSGATMEEILEAAGSCGSGAHGIGAQCCRRFDG